MLLFVIVLYAFGLDGERIERGGQHLVESFGWVERSVLLIVVLLMAVMFLLPKWHIRRHAKPLIRVLISFFVMLVLFEAVSYYIAARKMPMMDLDLQKVDSFLFFGKQPAEWLESISVAPLTTLLSTAYVSWFALTYGTIFLMVLKGKRAVLEYATVALTTFYIGYLLYLVVPAYGPVFTFDYDTEIGGLTHTLLAKAPSADAFPSLHTAISVVMLVQVWKHCRRWVWLYAPMATMIIFSTIYLRIHYGIDVIAGIVLAVITTQVCPLLIEWWIGRRSGSRGGRISKKVTEEKIASV
jgi:membrane-associated phospholipid phosphatase